MLELGVLTLGWLEALLLPLTRLTAFFLAAPLFPQVISNVRVRVVYALVLCILVLPFVPDLNAPATVDFPKPNLFLVINEILIGVSMGFVLQFVLAAVVVAGEQISLALGIGFAQAFDPTIGSTPVLSQFFNVLALLIFLTTGGHVLVVGMLVESLRELPPGSFSVLDLEQLVSFSAIVFSGAALLAAPLLLTLLSVNIGVGALSRATPALNIFAVGFAITLLVGFALLFILLPAMSERIMDLWQQAQSYLASRLLGFG
jgi:flagellar biosynthetic protein FliR